MLIISKAQVSDLIRRLEAGSELQACIDEVRKMVQIKSAATWRSDTGIGCCEGASGAISGAVSVEGEVALLENVQGALEEGDIPRGIALLRKYAETVKTTL